MSKFTDIAKKLLSEEVNDQTVRTYITQILSSIGWGLKLEKDIPTAILFNSQTGKGFLNDKAENLLFLEVAEKLAMDVALSKNTKQIVKTLVKAFLNKGLVTAKELKEALKNAEERFEGDLLSLLSGNPIPTRPEKPAPVAAVNRAIIAQQPAPPTQVIAGK